ncbi:MAG TPA: hypothetical protein VGM03_01235, partial [Phycisphaerae bacterium]
MRIRSASVYGILATAGVILSLSGCPATNPGTSGNGRNLNRNLNAGNRNANASLNVNGNGNLNV